MKPILCGLSARCIFEMHHTVEWVQIVAKIIPTPKMGSYSVAAKYTTSNTSSTRWGSRWYRQHRRPCAWTNLLKNQSKTSVNITYTAMNLTVGKWRSCPQSLENESHVCDHVGVSPLLTHMTSFTDNVAVAGTHVFGDISSILGSGEPFTSLLVAVLSRCAAGRVAFQGVSFWPSQLSSRGICPRRCQEQAILLDTHMRTFREH